MSDCSLVTARRQAVEEALVELAGLVAEVGEDLMASIVEIERRLAEVDSAVRRLSDRRMELGEDLVMDQRYVFVPLG